MKTSKTFNFDLEQPPQLHPGDLAVIARQTPLHPAFADEGDTELIADEKEETVLVLAAGRSRAGEPYRTRYCVLVLTAHGTVGHINTIFVNEVTRSVAGDETARFGRAPACESRRSRRAGDRDRGGTHS